VPTAVDSPITVDAAWFVGEDKLLTFTTYIPGTTLAAIAADQITPNGAIRQDITGWTIEWVLRKSRYATATMLVKNGASVSILSQGVAATKGQFTVAVVRADTTTPAVFKAGTYFHGAARINTGAYDVIAEGPAVLRKAAIR
jgi:hypothetical protein